MNNLSMARKLGIGFGLITALVCLLGYMAYMALSDSERNVTTMSKAYMPAAELASNSLDKLRLARIAILQFEASTNKADYDEATKNLGIMASDFSQMQRLSSEYPALKTLAATVQQFPALHSGYKGGCEATATQIENSEAARKAMVASAEKAEAALQKLLEGFAGAENKFVADGDMQALARNSENQRLAADVALQFKEIRRLYANARRSTDTSIRGGVAEASKKALAELATLTGRMMTEAGRNNCAIATNAVTSYLADLEVVLSAWERLNKINIERREMFANFAVLLEKLNDAANKNADTFAEETAYFVHASATRVFIIAGSMVCLAVILSILLTRMITVPLGKSMHFAQAVAQGNLEEKLTVNSRDEVGKLADALRSMVEALKTKIAEAQEQAEQAQRLGEDARRAMEEARQAHAAAESAKREGMLDAARHLEGIVEVVSSASAQLSAQVEESEQGAAVTSERITETATAMEEMNATVLEVARSAGGAAQVSNDARAKAIQGAEIVESVVSCIHGVERQSTQLKEDMGHLGQQAEAIGTIMNVISDIADQTNLLALNAAIEAARAGDAGRGFAVVADEVRKLAEKTMQATDEVGSAIKGVQQSAEKNMHSVDASSRSIAQATELAQQAGGALKEIVHLVDASADQVRTIAAAAEEQSSTSEEINRSLGTVNNASTKTARAMAEAAQAVTNLSHQARNLSRLIEDMKRG